MPLMALVVLFAVTTVTLGCASTNTPAQDLSWERWKTCDRFSTIALDRIDPDGRLVVKGHQFEAALFTACVREAATDQVRRGVASSPEAAVLVKVYGCLGGAM